LSRRAIDFVISRNACIASNACILHAFYVHCVLCLHCVRCVQCVQCVNFFLHFMRCIFLGSILRLSLYRASLATSGRTSRDFCAFEENQREDSLSSPGLRLRTQLVDSDIVLGLTASSIIKSQARRGVREVAWKKIRPNLASCI